MCNCGKKRAGLNNPPSQTTITPSVPTTSKPMNATFKYIGFASLTVTGSSTGKLYIFNHHGDTQTVDGNDSAFMSGISVLKRM